MSVYRLVCILATLTSVFLLSGCNSRNSTLDMPVKVFVENLDFGEETVLDKESGQRLFHLFHNASKEEKAAEVTMVQFPPYIYRVAFVFPEGYEQRWEIDEPGTRIFQPRTYQTRVLGDDDAALVTRILEKGLENDDSKDESGEDLEMPELPPFPDDEHADNVVGFLKSP